VGLAEAAQLGEAAGDQRCPRTLAEAEPDRDAGGDGEAGVTLVRLGADVG